MVVYNNPKFTGFEIEIPTLKRLSQISNINYYKDASGNTGRLLQLSNVVGNDLKIFSASAHVPVFVMMLGGAGWMAGPACLLPRESVMLYELCEKKHWDEAFRLQKIMWEVNRVFQKYNLAACVKAGFSFRDFQWEIRFRRTSRWQQMHKRKWPRSSGGFRKSSIRLDVWNYILNIILYPI